MQTAAVLSQGNVHQKAEMVASIIKQFSIDIETLDSLLAGEVSQGGGSPDVQNVVQQQLAPVYEFMNTVQSARQQSQQQAQARINQELQTFSQTHEFYSDLAGTMADFMDVYAQSNRSLDLEGAYALALNAHPEIKKIVDQRAAASKAKGATRSKKNAASSVVDESTSTVSGAKGANSIRDALLESWDDAS